MSAIRSSSTCRSSELTSKAYARKMADEIVRGVKADGAALQLGRRLQGHHAHLGARQGRQLLHDDPFARHAVGRGHAGPGLHVQRLHGRVRPAAGPRRLDRAGQGALQLGRALDHLQGRQAASHHRRAGRHADRHGRAARDPERARLRHDHGRGGERAALLGDLRHDRHLQPHPGRGRARAAGAGLSGGAQPLHASASPPCTASACTTTASTAAPTRATTAW